MLRRPATLLLALFFVSGCLGPNYKRPAIETPDVWRQAQAQSTANLANTPWWDLFEDRVLRDLIKAALEENQDLKIAVERVVEARARAGFTRADLFPRLDLNTSAGALEVSRESFPEFGNGDNDSDLFAITGDVFWEIDLFGRIRRATESERALLFATDDARRAVTISLVAEVAAAGTSGENRPSAPIRATSFRSVLCRAAG